MQEMIVERQLQDEEARKQYLKSTGKTLFQYQKDLQEKSMTKRLFLYCVWSQKFKQILNNTKQLSNPQETV
jgi:hypothetical protein